LSRRVPGFAVLAVALLAGAPAAVAAHTPPAATPAPARRTATAARPAPGARAVAGTQDAAALAAQARAAEDEGQYARALAALRGLRRLTSPDADLELEIALDEARTGRADSAWARLQSPVCAGALADTLPPQRWRLFGPGREKSWLSGAHEGWHWYVARARAELALRLGRWDDAVAAATLAVRARPMSGREHLLLALAAGRAGDGARARAEADRAALLDPMLPEAHYLSGLWAWRAGARDAARAAFEAAIAVDPGDRDAALALVRLRLPSAPPDSLPRRFLRGPRRAGMITAPDGPKIEEDTPQDQLPGLRGVPGVTPPDSVKANPTYDKSLYVEATVLVDENGRAVLVDFPHFTPQRMPAGLMNALVRAARQWTFRPAMRLGHPLRMWINVQINLNP